MLIQIAFVGICFSAYCAVSCAYNVTKHPNWHLLPHETCGNSVPLDRIVGGNKASLGQYPWLARIGYSIHCRNEIIFQCAGALINKYYVVTAAHCVTNLPSVKCADDYSYRLVVKVIRLGENIISHDVDCDGNLCAEPYQDFTPTKILSHKDYGNPAYKNDIGLIRLNKQANFNGWVAPICLPKGEQLMKSYEGSFAEVAGFGLYDVGHKLSSDVLMTLTVPVRPTNECAKLYQGIADITKLQICAGGIIGEDSCGGDSGGPLMNIEAVNGKPPRYYLLGVVSFGTTNCGSTNQPGIYSRTSAYIKWILDNMYP